jgi:iron complex transport system ATP-binding protein
MDASGAQVGTLRAREVSFAYSGERWVLRGVTFALMPGEITAVVGPNGAGKSTLLRVLAGLATPHRGDVLVEGRALAGLAAGERAKRVAYIAQRGELSEGFSVRQTVALGRYAAGGGDGAHVERALVRCGLEGLAEEGFHRLSVGQQQRVALARALAQLGGITGGVLLADEPLASLDPRHAGLAAAILREEAAAGRAVAVVVHDLTAAARLADRVVVLNSRGTMTAWDAPGEALSPVRLRRLFGVAFDRADTPGGAVIAPRFEPGDAQGEG